MPAFLRNPPWIGSPLTLKGKGVYLRVPQLSDWAEWARLRAASRDFLAPWEPIWLEDELTKNAYRRRLRRYSRDSRDGVGYAFFIFRNDDDCLLGGITLSNVRRGVTQSCSVGCVDLLDTGFYPVAPHGLERFLEARQLVGDTSKLFLMDFYHFLINFNLFLSTIRKKN